MRTPTNSGDITGNRFVTERVSRDFTYGTGFLKPDKHFEVGFVRIYRLIKCFHRSFKLYIFEHCKKYEILDLKTISVPP
jgi:hypothetical protein